jgi:Ca-activated chloride channel family protein
MKRILLLSAALFFPTEQAMASELWDSLWLNANQRAEKLLSHGDATGAAKSYQDPRHKAYAELKAGDFAKAAQGFSRFDDSDGNYNRGNALARSGKLQDAIKAYDAALAHDPKNKDAKHNRDLLEKLMQQQLPQSKDANKQSAQSDGKQGKQQDNNAKGSGDKQNQNSPSQNGKDQQGKSAQSKPGSDGKQSAGQQPSPQNQPAVMAKSNTQANSQAQPNQSQSRQSQSKQGQAQSAASANAQKAADDAAQAQRDASAALGKSSDKNAVPAAADVPSSEKQLAQEQWLRQIPDDPSGLLRRKFLIEHMLRQQGGQQ